MQPVKATPLSHGSGLAGPLYMNAVNGNYSKYMSARHLSSVISTRSSPTASLALARGRSLGLSPANRRGPVNRLSPVMSSSYAEAEHVPDNGQTDRAQAWSLLLVPAVVTATLSRVIDGKGLLLASYWAVRYFAPAALSLWAAKHARKHWDFLSAAMVMAATYAVSIASSYRIWTGPTSTVKMHYPLFNGKITIPAVVGQWIRHNRGLAKILTKMLAWGPWVFLTLAAALQIAVWMDGTAHRKAEQRVAAKHGSQHSNPEGFSGLSPGAAGAQATASSSAPPAPSSAAFVVSVSQSDSAGGGTTGFRAPLAAAQSRTVSKSAELLSAHGSQEEQNSSPHSNGDSQFDGRPDAYDSLTQLSGIWRSVFAHLCSLERGGKFEKEYTVYLRNQLHVVHQYHQGPSCELCSLLRSYMEDTLEAVRKSVQRGNFDAYLARTKMHHAKTLAKVEDFLEIGPRAEQLRKREALIEHLMPGALEEAAKQSSHQDLEHSSERSPIAPSALHSHFAEVHDSIAEEGEDAPDHWDEFVDEDDEDIFARYEEEDDHDEDDDDQDDHDEDDDDEAEQESDSDAKDEDEDDQGDYEDMDAMIAHELSQVKISEGSCDGSHESWAVRRQGKADSMEARHEAVQADELSTSTINWLMPHGAGADQARLKEQPANAEDSRVSNLHYPTHPHDQVGQLEGNLATQLEAAEQQVQQLEGQLTHQLFKLGLKANTLKRLEAAEDLQLLARKLKAACLARLDIVTNSHEQQMRQLKQQHEKGIAIIESDKAEQLEELQDEHEGDVAIIKSEHEVLLEKLRQQHEEHSASIKSEYQENADELELLHAQNEGELEQLGHAHAEELEQLREEHEDDQRKSVDDHEEQLAELREEHEQNIRSLKQQMAALPVRTEKHQQELHDMESEHAMQVKELHSKLETMTAQQQRGANKLAMINDEITSLQGRQEQLQRSLSQTQKDCVYLRNVVAQKAEQHSSEVGSLREQLEEALEEEDRLRGEEQVLRKHAEVSRADDGDKVPALQDKFAIMHTQLVSEAVQVPAPAVVQNVEDAIAADASEPAAAPLTFNAVEDGMAATDKTLHDGSSEVEVQVESSGDEEGSASGAVQVNVQSARDMPGTVEIHIESGDEEDDHLASGAVKVNIHSAGVNDKPKQELVTIMNIAETNSDGNEFRKGDSDNDDGDGMIPVNVHTSLLG
ncbi:hypothetical protein WJX77_004891 [Trebouxia sp. C0004]